MAGKIELLTPSNGKVALVGEDTATDVTVTVPAGDAELVSTDTLRTELNATGSAPIYACRAWVNFNGTGTVAIRASGNVSSITDNGTSDYTVNFTTAMPDASYAVSGVAQAATSGSGSAQTYPLVTVYSDVSPTTSAVRIFVRAARDAYGLFDYPSVYLTIFR